MGDDIHNHGSASQFVEVDEEAVRIVDTTLVDQQRSLVAVVGPPGAGKSTLCNTLYHIAFGSEDSFFEPSASPTSYTKGLWLLSNSARKNLPKDITWECVDMEGFQVDLMSSWKMAMVLCVLSGLISLTFH
jgi:GTPase SAR1 family protein